MNSIKENSNSSNNSFDLCFDLSLTRVPFCKRGFLLDCQESIHANFIHILWQTMCLFDGFIYIIYLYPFQWIRTICFWYPWVQRAWIYTISKGFSRSQSPATFYSTFHIYSNSIGMYCLIRNSQQTVLSTHSLTSYI